jgi:hypothetical protein
MQMSDDSKPVRSMIHWVEPPEVGQPLEELEWTFIDVFEDGRASDTRRGGGCHRRAAAVFQRGEEKHQALIR